MSYAIENFRPVVRIEGRSTLTGAKFYPTVLFFCLKAISRITFFILFRASNHKRCRQRESKLICIWSLHIWIQISHTIPTGLSFVRQSVLNKYIITIPYSPHCSVETSTSRPKPSYITTRSFKYCRLDQFRNSMLIFREYLGRCVLNVFDNPKDKLNA